MTKNEIPQSITFYACELLACGDLNAQRQLSSENKYLYPGSETSGLYKGLPCPGWSNVWWITTYKGWTYTPNPSNSLKALKSQINIFKGTVQSNCHPLQCNPITIKVNKADGLINCTFGLGADVTGKDPMARFRIAVWDPPSIVTKGREK